MNPKMFKKLNKLCFISSFVLTFGLAGIHVVWAGEKKQYGLEASHAQASPAGKKAKEGGMTDTDNLTEEEQSFINQYLINSFKWINDNREDLEVNAETIRTARKSVEYNLKPIIAKLYAY